MDLIAAATITIAILTSTITTIAINHTHRQRGRHRRANTHNLHKALKNLNALLPEKQRNEMTNPTPTDNVSISQTDLDNFAAEFETVKTSLAGYIAQLQATQSQPLPPADESGLQQALADLTGLEPPVTSPVVTPPAPTTPPPGALPTLGS